MQKETVVSERVALTVWQLCNGERMTTRKIAHDLGLTRSGAYLMMRRLSNAGIVEQVPSLEGAKVWIIKDIGESRDNAAVIADRGIVLTQ